MSDLLKATRITPPISSSGITTGQVGAKNMTSTQHDAAAGGESSSFLQMLSNTLAQNTAVGFSRHAVSRVAQRNIDVSQSNLERLEQGMRLAQERGMRESMILIDRTAFIVSVENNKVITTVEGDELQGSVFTNIDGAVII